MLTIEGFQKAFQYWQLFLQGVVCTVSLSALTVIFGFILALVIATCRLGRSKILRIISTAYVELFRATPMVVQVFIIFYVVFDGVKVLPGFKLFGFGVQGLDLVGHFGQAGQQRIGVAAFTLDAGHFAGGLVAFALQGFQFA